MAETATGMVDAVAEITSGGLDAVVEFTTWVADSASEITSGVVDWVSGTETGMVDTVAEVTSGGKDAVTETTTWTGDVADEIETGATPWETTTSDGMDDVAAAVETGGATATTNTTTWCGNVESAIGTGGTNWISKMSTGMGGVVEAITSGGVSAVTGTKLWTAEAGGVIDQWATDAAAAVADVAYSIDALNAKWAEQQTNYISDISDEPEPDKDNPLGIPEHTITQITELEGGGWRANWYTNGRQENMGSTQDNLVDLIGGMQVTQKVWGQMTPDQQYNLRQSGGGPVHTGLDTDPAPPSGGRISGYAHGGLIPQDMVAQVHAGEFVVPKREVDEFLNGSRGMDITINYNIGTVYGVNDLQRLLDKHDKELVRKLGALV